MRRQVECEGRTLEEATEKALSELGVEMEEANLEVLDDGKSGFLGFGSRSAKVRAIVKEEGAETAGAPQPLAAGERELEGGAAKKEALSVEEEDLPDVDYVRELVLGLVRRMHMDGEIESKVRDGRLVLNVVGKDSNLLIGKKGQTLDSLQYLVNLMYSKSAKKKAGIVVDVEEYKVRRERRLQTIAQEVSDKVKKTGKPIAIAPMNAQDRRIIHIALQDDDSVRTVSKGEGSLRKVVVIPK